MSPQSIFETLLQSFLKFTMTFWFKGSMIGLILGGNNLIVVKLNFYNNASSKSNGWWMFMNIVHYEEALRG